jgi:hypothetical protein
LEASNRDKTPFSWFTTNGNFKFYRFKVSDENSTEKSGYLCIAGQFSPFFPQKVRGGLRQ